MGISGGLNLDRFKFRPEKKGARLSPKLTWDHWETMKFESCWAPPHDSNFMVSEGSRESLGGPERWLGPLCVQLDWVGA